MIDNFDYQEFTGVGEPSFREKEWSSFFQHSQRILGLFLLFSLVTAGIVLAILSFQKKERGEIEKNNVLGVEKTAVPPNGRQASAAATSSPLLLAVDLGGAVNKTGVFRLPEGSRLEDLLNLAGGLSAAADPGWVAKNLNLAEKLFDGEKIYIPAHGEVAPPGGGQAWGGTSAVGGEKLMVKVNLNTATAAQLDALPGLSLTDAQGIVAYRQKYGPFKDISEVQQVSGIKSGKFAKIKDLISVN